MSAIREALLAEENLAKQLTQLKHSIITAVADEKSTAEMINRNCCTVKASFLDSTILSPSYYLQSAQASIIKNKMDSIKTITDLISFLHNAATEKKVKVSGETERLNSSTVKVLQSFLDGIG